MEELFKAETQDRFLALAYKFYHNKTDPIYLCKGASIIFVSERHDIKIWLYKLGRDYNILDMDFFEFERFLTGKYRKYNYNHYYSWGHNCPPEQWRVLRGFTFNGQVKKSKKETPRQAWREHKKFRKDKNRARHWSNWKRDLKHFGAKKHRAMERIAIAGEKTDNLGANSYKEAENPWSWD